jgi:nuclear pore complex protein Nup205
LLFVDVCEGEAQQPYYPGLPRGLVAILLYYDGKVCLAQAMRTMLQARAGRTWVLPGLSSDVIHTITSVTDQLIEEGLIGKILGKFIQNS